MYNILEKAVFKHAIICPLTYGRGTFWFWCGWCRSSASALELAWHLFCLRNILWTSGWILIKFSWIYIWDIAKKKKKKKTTTKKQTKKKLARFWWPRLNFQGHSGRKIENSRLGDISFLWKLLTRLCSQVRWMEKINKVGMVPKL